MPHPYSIVSGALAALALSLPVSDVRAQQADVSKLRLEVDALKRSMQEMQMRLQAIEASLEQMSNGAAAVSTSAPKPAPSADTKPSTPAGAGSVAATEPAQGAQAPPPQPANMQLVALKRAWADIKTGVPNTRVKELLGDPTEELRLNGKLTWYYAYPGIGAGSIFFNEDGRVSSRKSPFFELAW